MFWVQNKLFGVMKGAVFLQLFFVCHVNLDYICVAMQVYTNS